MDLEEYRRRGKEMIDYTADYLKNIRDRPVFPDVKPGYIRHLQPEEAPEHGEDWDTIFSDVERVVMPGLTHFQSPHMHAYYPANMSFPSILGELLATATSSVGITWSSSPAVNELESLVMDWLGKLIGLPSEFLRTNKDSLGGGVIQSSSSETTLVVLLAARKEAIRRYKIQHPDSEDNVINGRLVAYASDQSHSSVEKAGLMTLIKFHYIETDDELSMRGDALAKAIAEDRDKGLIPFFVCATVGTTGSCAFDNLREIGVVSKGKSEDIWLHVDAAYGGVFAVCPEFRHWMDGVEYADSVGVSGSKGLLVNFDAATMWVKDYRALNRTFNVRPLYLQHDYATLDYMDWQIPMTRRFRALKFWFVLRSFGVSGMQKNARHVVYLGEEFEKMVKADNRFEIAAKRYLGLVVFRLKGPNIITEALLKKLNSTGKVQLVPAAIKGKYVIRFAICSSQITNLSDIQHDWELIKSMAPSDVSCP